MLAFTPLILRKSRMRKRARTDLRGGRSVMIVPTATVIGSSVGLVPINALMGSDVQVSGRIVGYSDTIPVLSLSCRGGRLVQPSPEKWTVLTP